MALTTLDEVLLFLNTEYTTLSNLEVAQIEMLIPQIDGVICNYCGWNLLATDYVDKRYNGSGTDTLDLRLYPINTLTQVRLRDSDGTFTDVTSDLEILEGGLIACVPGADTTTFTSGTRNYFVSFNAGFTEDAIPRDLSYAAASLAIINLNRMRDESAGSKIEKFNNISFENSELDLPILVTRVLDRYRLISIF